MSNNYSLSELFKTAWSLVITKITFSQARLIRRPVYIRGRRSIDGAIGLTTGRFCRFDLEGSKKTLYIGTKCEMGDMTHIVAHEKVEIGNNVLIASKCFISDTNHGSYSGELQDAPDSAPNNRSLYTKPVVIGNNVWIGENVVVLAGSIIGNGCIIGANSVVNGKFEDNTIIAGATATVKKIWNEEEHKWIKVQKNL